MPKITEPGIYPDFPNADYFADPCPTPSLTQSIAKVLIDQSPLHARTEHPRFAEPTAAEAEDAPEKYIAAQAIGNAAHALIIGRGKDLAIADFDSWRGKEAQKIRDEATFSGLTPILAKHFDTARVMVEAARLQLSDIADLRVRQAFVVGHGEVVIAAEADGIWLRSLVDWMVDPALLFDFKSTGMSVAPHVIPNLMADAGWPIQAAMQERILDLVDPGQAGRRRFFFIAQENYKPFALTIHELPEGTMTMGRKMVAKAEAMWREAITSGKWPGYDPIIHRPEYPGWKESQWLAREVADDDRRTNPMLTSLAGG